MITISRQTLTTLASDLKSHTGFKHTFCLHMVACALGFTNSHSAISHLRKHPIVIDTDARYKNLSWGRLYKDFKTTDLQSGLMQKYSQLVKLVSTLVFEYNYSEHQAWLYAAVHSGNVQINSKGLSLCLSSSKEESFANTYFRGEWQEAPGCKVIFQEEMSVSLSHFLSSKGLDYILIWKTIGIFLKVITNFALAPLHTPSLIYKHRIERISNKADTVIATTLNIATKTGSSILGIKKKMVLGEVLQAAILQHLSNENGIWIIKDNKKVPLHLNSLELFSPETEKQPYARDDWFYGIRNVSPKPIIYPLQGIELGKLEPQHAASIIANTNTRIFMRSSDIDLTKEGNKLVTIDNGNPESIDLINELIEPEMAQSIISCNNTRIFMRAEPDRHPKELQIGNTGKNRIDNTNSNNTDIGLSFKIKDGSSSRAQFLLEVA